jgi:hypothetical protein
MPREGRERMTPKEMDALLCHITDQASLKDYLTMGYRLEESDPHWLLYDQNDAPCATVDRAMAESCTEWEVAKSRIGI